MRDQDIYFLSKIVKPWLGYCTVCLFIVVIGSCKRFEDMTIFVGLPQLKDVFGQEVEVG